MKVIIAEAGAANNIGSMALIENAIRIARKKHPGCNISVFCLDARSVSDTLEKDKLHDKVTVLNDLFVIPSGGIWRKSWWMLINILWILYSRLILLFTKHISRFFCGRRKLNLQEVEQSEYVYCIGAERINDIYYKTALLSLLAIGTYIHMGKRLVHLSLTIGPVFNKSTIIMAKKVLNNSHAIFVGDQKSFDILKEWKCKSAFQFSSYDIALLQNINNLNAQTLLDEFGIQKGFVGVSCINWSFRRVNGPIRQEGYEQAIAEVLDHIIEKYGFQVVFTPTVVNPSQKDDVFIGKHVLRKMKNHKQAVIIERLLTPVEMATLFTQCTFSIVTRMHAAILCSGAGNHPIIAINYLYKLREYMKNLLCEEYSIDIDCVTSVELMGFVDKLMRDYDTEYKRIENRKIHIRSKLIDDLARI